MGLFPAALLGRLRADEMRAPRCGTRARADRRLPVLDEPAVGELGLGGELLVEVVVRFGCEGADPRYSSGANSVSHT